MSIGASVTSLCDGPLDMFFGVQLEGPIAYVDVYGPISRECPIESCYPPYEAWTGENELIDLLSACRSDDRCKAVVLRIDSPGGESNSMPAIVRALDDLAEAKPVIAHVDHDAYSAAYWIACRAHQIWMASPMAGVGSIGTILTVIDNSKHLERLGIQMDHYTDADDKMLFQDGVPADENTRKKAMRLIGPISEMFHTDVVGGRGVSRQLIIELNGAVVMAKEAIEIGLADAIVARADLHAAATAALEAIQQTETMAV